MTHYVYWKKYRPDLHGKPCRIIARGSASNKNAALQFESGEVVVMPRYSYRKIP